MMKNILSYGLRRNYRGFGWLTKHTQQNGEILYRNKYGVLLSLDPYDKIDSCVLRYGYFDDNVLNALSNRCLKDDVFWDVGVNFGLHALTLEKLCDLSEIYGFEPSSSNYRKLLRNIELNGSNLAAYNIGLDYEISIRKLYVTSGNSGATSFIATLDNTLTPSHAASFSGDSLAMNFGLSKPNIIKIDAEGNENNIINGMVGLLEDNRLHTIIYENNLMNGNIECVLKRYKFKVERLGDDPNFIAYR